MSRRDTDLLANINRRLRAANRSNTMNKLETLIAAVSAQIRADFGGVNLDDFDRIEVSINGVERKPKAEPEPVKIDHPWTDWVAGDVNKCPIPGDTRIIGRLRAGFTVEGLAEGFSWRELDGPGTLVAYKILEAAPEQKPADSEPKFIEWNGGENPAPGKLVVVKLRSGSTHETGMPSRHLDWSYDGVDGDIVGYRVVGDDPDVETPNDAAEPDSNGDGWIEWDGGGDTEPRGLVQVRFRDGIIATARGELFSWAHHLTSYGEPDDIVAYRYLDKACGETAQGASDTGDGGEDRSLSRVEAAIIGDLRLMRRHALAALTQLEGPIPTERGHIFPCPEMVQNAKTNLGRAFDAAVLAFIR